MSNTGLKPDGARVRELNNMVDDALANAESIVYDALSTGSVDPVDYVKAFGALLRELRAARTHSHEISMITTLAARRGPYKKDGGNGR